MATKTLSKSTLVSSLWGEVQPLTTTWMPPPGCPEVVQFHNVDSNNKSETAGLSCAPPNYANVWWRRGYYSPGICPHNYTRGMTLGPGHTLNGNWISSSETAAICVPSGYTVWPDSDANYTFWAGISVVAPARGDRTWDGTSKVPAFEIRWAASDLAPLTTASFWGPTGSFIGPTAAASPSLRPATATAESAGLSRGTVAVIVLGVVVGFVLVLAVVVWFILRRRRRARVKPQHAGAELEVGDSERQGPSELCAGKTQPINAELDGGAFPIVEKQIEKDDAALVEADAHETLATAEQHQQYSQTRDQPVLPAQVLNSDNVGPVEMDVTPARSTPAHYATEPPPSTPLPPAPAEFHAAALVSPSYSTGAELSQGRFLSQTVSEGIDSEIAQLLERKARVDERRRALELEQLDAEAAVIESRLNQLSQLQGGGSSHARKGR